MALVPPLSGAAIFLIAMIFCPIFGFWYLSHLTDHLVRSAALESAAQQSDLLLEVNNSYSDVVKRAKAGKLPVTHDYASNPTAIPIPATFTIELGQQISDRSQTGVQIRLYSDYPFLAPNGGPKDDFERDALVRLRANPAEPVYRFEEYKGRPALRYATARQMQETCVDCHNTHPDSPKTDWKVGDVRGVVEIIHPLDKDAAQPVKAFKGRSSLLGWSAPPCWACPVWRCSPAGGSGDAARRRTKKSVSEPAPSATSPSASEGWSRWGWF